MSTLELIDVFRHFGGVRAVEGLNLLIRPGKITGLIGPNGAGKSTVVNMISGLIALTNGQIKLGSRDISSLSAVEVARCGISRTFQNIKLLQEATVLENVMVGFHRHEQTSLAANLLGLISSLREKRVLKMRSLAILQRLKIDQYADRPAGALSYGHQRRVEIARALATQPLTLLLDEPVAGMNDVEAMELGEVFKDVAADGVGILLIEHNMRFVMQLCEDLTVISSGRMICAGTPDTVRNDPQVISAYLG